MDKIKKLDIFGSVVTLTHNGTNKYKTRLGALFSIIFAVGILVIAIEGFLKIFTN